VAEAKKLMFSLSKDRGDFTVEYYNGEGCGGQHRNKRQMACRIHHPKSGALAACQEERSQKANRERAFERLCGSERFQKWLRIETARRAGLLDDIESKVDAAMKEIQMEVHDEKGRWTKVPPDYEWKEEE
jgi:protein subunit release factor B